MNWSQYQLDIFNEVEQTKHNLAIQAVAGSGKTTTLVNLVNHLRGYKKILFLAFNKHIADELRNRLKNVECRTLHSVGMKMIRKPGLKLKDEKYRNIIFDSKYSQKYKRDDARAFVKLATNCLSMVQKTLTSSEDFIGMLENYNLMLDVKEFVKDAETSYEDVIHNLRNVVYESIELGMSVYKEEGLITYDDMIFVPIYYKLLGQYDCVLVDEAQDLNAAQLQLVLQLANNGRVIAVGDKFQSMYAFSGAMPNSFDEVVKALDAKVMPLSVSYRCPIEHVKLAKTIVPIIEHAPNAKKGTIGEIKPEELLKYVTKNDLVICRRNAPLVSLALNFIANGIQARVKGKDFSSELNSLVKRIDKLKDIFGEDFYTVFNAKMRKYQGIKFNEFAGQENGEMLIDLLNDKLVCVKTILDSTMASSLTELEETIANLFADETSAIFFSSIHRAKGLEAENVYIVDPDRIRLNFKNMAKWQHQQEANINYVGLTRAKNGLFFVKENA